MLADSVHFTQLPEPVFFLGLWDGFPGPEECLTKASTGRRPHCHCGAFHPPPPPHPVYIIHCGMVTLLASEPQELCPLCRKNWIKLFWIDHSFSLSLRQPPDFSLSSVG